MNERRPKTNWALVLQALGLAFTFLVVLVGGLMAYAYMNGSTARTLENHEYRIKGLEDRRGTRAGSE